MSFLNNAHAWSASIVRASPRGLVNRNDRLPELAAPLELYEFESCPFCRKAREAMSELDLAFVSRPCSRGSNNRSRVVQLGGKTQFPYLVDPNTGFETYESEDIIDYLWKEYGPGRNPWERRLSLFDTVGAAAASMIRPRGGAVRTGAERAQPEHLLKLYGFEASPYCRKVRETLHELNLDFLTLNVAKRSRRRPELIDRGGKMMVPYLIDPNTGTEMYESSDIVRYLEHTYG